MTWNIEQAAYKKAEHRFSFETMLGNPKHIDDAISARYIDQMVHGRAAKRAVFVNLKRMARFLTVVSKWKRICFCLETLYA